MENSSKEIGKKVILICGDNSNKILFNNVLLERNMRSDQVLIVGDNISSEKHSLFESLKLNDQSILNKIDNEILALKNNEYFQPKNTRAERRKNKRKNK